jgi:hypothetical protein
MRLARVYSRVIPPRVEGNVLKKTKWQRIAEERARDSRALLGTKRWTASYYLAGGVLPWIKNHW